MENESERAAGARGEANRWQDPNFGQSAAKVSRWAARGISLVVLAIWGFFIIAHLIGSITRGGEEASTPLGPDDYVGLLAMGAWLVGLVIGWKSEPIGGAVVILAFAVSAAMNPNVLAFPFVLIPVAGTLFLVSWWIRRSSVGAKPIRDVSSG